MSERMMVQALRGQPTSRRPLWIMRQAGRYLPEYRALRQKHPFEQLCGDPALAAEVTLQPLRRFPLDAAIVFADLMSPLAALGIAVRFDPGPVLDAPVRTEAAVRALRTPAPGEIAPEVPAALRILRREIPESTTLLGFSGAPLSLAAYVVEGEGSKSSFPILRSMIAGAPALFADLMNRLARLSADYLIEQAKAGADAVQIFDTWAGLVSRETWLAHVRAPLLELLLRVGEAGVPRILFVNDAPHLLADYAALPCEALACDWRIDMLALRELAGESRAIQGNIDPAVLLAGPDPTRAAARALLARVPARGHVVNLGHGILPETPIAAVHALIEAVHDEVRPG